MSLKKFERMYPRGKSWRTGVVNNTVYHFVGPDLEVQIFLKKREHHKKGLLKQRTEAPLHTLYWGFKKTPSKACLLFCFLLIRRILKALFSFILWLLNSSDLRSYDSNSRKRHTLRSLRMCIGKSIPRIGGKAPLLLFSLQFP